MDVHLRVARSRREFERELGEWLKGDNTQFLYVGTHGAPHGLGSSAGDFSPWEDVATLLSTAQIAPVVWLGACHSSCAAGAWSHWATDRPPAAWLTTFTGRIPPSVCRDMVVSCLDNTRIDGLVFVDEELPLLRATVDPSVDLFYPVISGSKRSYIHADSFEQVLGKSFRQHLIEAKETW